MEAIPLQGVTRIASIGGRRAQPAEPAVIGPFGAKVTNNRGLDECVRRARGGPWPRLALLHPLDPRSGRAVAFDDLGVRPVPEVNGTLRHSLEQGSGRGSAQLMHVAAHHREGR